MSETNNVENSVPQSNIDFTQVFSSEAFDAIRDTVVAFLKSQNNARNASLDFQNKNVYLRATKDRTGADDIQIHIVYGEKPESEIPMDEDDDEE